jgi:hypothetical protein
MIFIMQRGNNGQVCFTSEVNLVESWRYYFVVSRRVIQTDLSIHLLQLPVSSYRAFSSLHLRGFHPALLFTSIKKGWLWRSHTPGKQALLPRLPHIA